MTNYNERLNKIFYQYGMQVAESAADDWQKHEALTEFTKVDMTNHYSDTKQAITSLIKELVAEAKPSMAIISDEEMGIDRARKSAANNAIDQFEQNLLKALEEV